MFDFVSRILAVCIVRKELTISLAYIVCKEQV